MPTAMSDALFMKVDEGWVYRAPNPWVFGDCPHYLVNDEQKAQLTAIITPRHPVRLGVYIALILIAWVVAIAGLATISSA